MAKELRAKRKNYSSGPSAGELEKELERMKDSAPVMVLVSELVTEEPFVSAFALKDGGFEEIVQSVAEKGFDSSEAIVVWENDGRKVVVDGHRRKAAAERAGLLEIPAYVKHFEDSDQALAYIYYKQFWRRQIDDSVLMDFAENANWNVLGKGSKKSKLAALGGKGETTAQRILTVVQSADESQKQAIRDGRMTVHYVYELIKSEGEEGEDKAARAPKRSPRPDAGERSEADDLVEPEPSGEGEESGSFEPVESDETVDHVEPEPSGEGEETGPFEPVESDETVDRVEPEPSGEGEESGPFEPVESDETADRVEPEPSGEGEESGPSESVDPDEGFEKEASQWDFEGVEEVLDEVFRFEAREFVKKWVESDNLPDGVLTLLRRLGEEIEQY